MLASSRTPRGTANTPGGINPAPTNLPKPPAKPDGRNHPGVRRAGCPHPAAPRGGANISILNRQCAAGVNARPTEPGKCGGQPGNRGPALQQTPVGDDACIVPHTPRHRKRPGRDKSRPYKPSEHDPPNRDGRDHPGDRRAGCPHPAAPRGGANTRGRIWNPPLRNGRGCGRIRDPPLHGLPALRRGGGGERGDKNMIRQN